MEPSKRIWLRRKYFARYGLDRPQFLNSLNSASGAGQDGRSVLLVSSRDAISEPFVSFLIDVNWPRGRLLREYTVLLDPPVLMRRRRQPGARAACRADHRAGRATECAAAAAGGSSSVTAHHPRLLAKRAIRSRAATRLYGIAGSLAGDDRQAIQRTMIAVFRANPDAFNGNINQLRAGAILRIPPSSEIANIATAEAASEVRSQNAAWRAAGGGAESGKLKLVTPPEGEAAAEVPDTSGRVESQIGSLEKDIAEQRRLLELRNQELADLQAKLAKSRAEEEAAKVPEPAPEAVTPEPPGRGIGGRAGRRHGTGCGSTGGGRA